MADNLFSGLATGFVTGQQLGFQKQQLTQQQAQQEAQEEQAEFNRFISQAEIGINLASNNKLPLALRNQGLQMFKDAATAGTERGILDFDASKIGGITLENISDEAFTQSKELFKQFKVGKDKGGIDFDQFLIGINELGETIDKGVKESLVGRAEEIRGGREQARIAEERAAFREAVPEERPAIAEQIEVLGGEIPEIPEVKEEKISPFSRLLQEHNLAIKEGRVEDAALLKRKIEKEASTRQQRISINPDGTVTIEEGVGIGGGLARPVVTQLQKDIIEADKQLLAFGDIDSMFDPKFLTFTGATQAMFERFAGKAGIPVDSNFVEKQKAFFIRSKQLFLAYRKWVTGVAGGEKEMQEIERAFISPEVDILKTMSPAEFKAALREQTRWTRKVRNWQKRVLDSGIPKNAAASEGITISNTPEFMDISEIPVDELLNMRAQ